MAEEKGKEVNPTFEDFMEFEKAERSLMENLDRILAYLAPRWRLTWEEVDEVRARTLLKAVRWWPGVPKDKGQKGWLRKAAWHSYIEMLHEQSRRFIDTGRLLAAGTRGCRGIETLSRLAGQLPLTPGRAVELLEVRWALDELRTTSPDHVEILVAREESGNTWDETTDRVPQCKRTCQTHCKDIKAIYAEEYPAHRELL